MRTKKQDKTKKELVKRSLPQKRAYSVTDDQTILAAVTAWAGKTTGSLSYRREDLQRDKQRSVLSFFAFTTKHPFSVRTRDCLAWRNRVSACAESNGAK